VAPVAAGSWNSGIVLVRVTGVLQLGTLGDEALAALLTAAANDITAGFGGHAGAETELVFARALGWLKGAFAHDRGLSKCSVVGTDSRLGARTLRISPPLSMRQ